jgi:CcmD family protein
MTVLKRVMTFAALILLLAAGSIAAEQPQQTEQQKGFAPVSELPPQDQLPAAPLLVSAYAFVWLAVFGYVVSVARRLSVVQRECERLEADISRGHRTP